MKLEKVLAYTHVIGKNEAKLANNLEISLITQDTRKVKKNSLFIAIKGANFDGHQMVEQAVSAGATAVVVERLPENIELPFILVKDTHKAMAQIANAFYSCPSNQLSVVGITGTNGKTTITHLIDQIATFSKQKTALIGTMYNKIDGEIFETVNTTPDSITLQELFEKMNKKNVDVCAMEVSSHGLYLGRTWGVDFDVAVFTNLTQDHLDFHGTMSHYFLSKSLLFSQMGNIYTSKNKLAVINIDDAYGEKLLPLTAMNTFTYSCQKEADLRADNIQITGQGTKFDLFYFGEHFKVTSPLIGDFNVSNLLAAIGASIGLGYPLTTILEAISQITAVKGRFELISNHKEVVAIVDYAHTPDGLENVLETVKKMTNKKVYCVVGCGGDRDKTKRPIMAQLALEYADMAIFTSDNPRTEDPVEILNDMTSSLEKENYLVEVDRKKAIHLALKLAKPGEVVLVAGKGHEDYQIIGKEKIHFDDSQVIQKYKQERTH